MNIETLKIKDVYPHLINNKSLIAVSGGVDSIVLSHLFHNSKLNFCIAHCNYCLRGEESDSDALLVKNLANTLGVEFFTKKFDTIQYSKTNNCSIQMAAREIRYNWFDELMKKNGLSCLVTGHHLNDQLETFLINLGRGTGINGLLGISENTKIIRPLLNFTKDEILIYAKKNNFNWNEDNSNLKNDYLRNSLRNSVISKWKKILPDLEKNFLKTVSQLELAEQALNIQLEDIKKTSFKLINSEFKIDINNLIKLKPKDFFLHALFKDYGFIYPKEISKLINSSSGKLITSGSHELLKDREFLILREIPKLNNKSYDIPLIPQKLNNPFDIEISLKPFKNPINSIQVDPNLLSSVLQIRKPYNGAYFFPSGMSGKKKLSKFFKDEKLSLFEKQNQWILTSNNQVVWVIGKRADRRFLSNTKSKKRMYIRIQPS